MRPHPGAANSPVRASTSDRFLAWLAVSRIRADLVALAALFAICGTVNAFWPLPHTLVTYCLIGLGHLVLRVGIFRVAKLPTVLYEMLLFTAPTVIFAWAISGAGRVMR